MPLTLLLILCHISFLIIPQNYGQSNTSCLLPTVPVNPDSTKSHIHSSPKSLHITVLFVCQTIKHTYKFTQRLYLIQKKTAGSVILNTGYDFNQTVMFPPDQLLLPE